MAVNHSGLKAKTSLLEQKVQITLPPYKAANAKNKRLHYKPYDYDKVERRNCNPNDLVPTAVGTIVKAEYYFAVELIYKVLVAAASRILSFKFQSSSVTHLSRYHPLLKHRLTGIHK